MILRGITPAGRAWDAEMKLNGKDPRVERAKLIVKRVEAAKETVVTVTLVFSAFVALPACFGLLLGGFMYLLYTWGAPESFGAFSWWWLGASLPFSGCFIAAFAYESIKEIAKERRR